MKLNLLIVDASQQAKDEGIVNFRCSTHHICEIFMYFLPRIEINGSSKIEILVGPQGNSAKFYNMLGCTNIFIDDFNFDNYYSLPIEEQQNIILHLIENTLINLIKNSSNNIEAINQVKITSEQVRLHSFSIEIPIKKLNKRTLDKRYIFNIYRVLNIKVGESWYCLVKENNNLLTNKWMTNVPSYIHGDAKFKKAEIINNKYLIKDNFNKVTFDIEF